MKKILLCWLLASFIFATNSAMAQATSGDTTKVKKDTVDKSKSDTAESDPNALDAHRDSIFKTMENKSVIARFKLSKPTIAIWKYIDDTTKRKKGVFWDKKAKRAFVFYKRVKLDQVHLLVKEGLLLEVNVTTAGGEFRNKKSIIDLVHFEDQGGQHLQYTGIPYGTDGKNRFIFLDDVFTYTPLGAHNDIPYADFDITLIAADTAHNYYNLTESTSLNTYFNVAAFTDVKGLNGSPNGIAQFRGEGKFITNTRNFPETATVPLNYLAFEGGLSKYDSQFNGTMLIHKDSVSRRDLFQRSTYSVGLKLNLLHGFASPGPGHLLSDWQINWGYNYIGSRVADTSFKDAARTIIDTAYRTVVQNDIYIEPMFTVSRHGNFGLTVALPFHFINIKGNANIKNNGWEKWVAPTIELMYYAQKDNSSKLFFRYRNYTNLGDHTQGFTQIQLGYSLNLSSIWGSSGN